MQPLVSRPGVGSILPIIDSTWSSRREKSSYSGLQRGVGVLLPAKPRARTLSIGRNPPTSPQEGVFPDFSHRIPRLREKEACPEDIRLHLSFLSVANIACILRKTFSRDQAAGHIRDLLQLCQAVGMSDIFLYDALQIACAEADNCDFILTSNIRHFQRYTRIPVYTPAEFLEKLT